MKELESWLNCWQMFPRMYFLLTYSFLWKYSYPLKIRDTLIIADYLLMGVPPALTSIIFKKNFSALLQHKEHMSSVLYFGLCDIRIWNKQKGQ